MERARLRDAIAANVPALISGPAGAGKSALAREVTLPNGPARPPRIVGLRTASHEPFLPFWPLAGPGATRSEVDHWLAGVADDQPLLVERAASLDDGSLSVLREWSGQRPLIITCRHDPSDDPPATLLEVCGEVIKLGPLDHNESRRLLRAQRPDLGGRTATALVDRAAGNPYILVALAHCDARLPLVLQSRLKRLSRPARALVARGLAGDRVAAADAPEAVAEILAAGLGRQVGGSVEVATVLRGIVDASYRPSTADVDAQDDRRITDREAQVLEVAAGGSSNAEIASALSISLATVESHIRSAMHKLGAHNRIHATRMAGRRRRSTERSHARMLVDAMGQSGATPQVLLRGSESRFIDLVDGFRGAGWDLVEGWKRDGPTGARCPIRFGAMKSAADATAVARAVAVGSGVLVHAQTSTTVTADLVEDLSELGPTVYVDESAGVLRAALTSEQLELLTLLADGRTLSEAAHSTSVSPRTAARRLADAKRVLRVPSTIEAISLLDGTLGGLDHKH